MAPSLSPHHFLLLTTLHVVQKNPTLLDYFGSHGSKVPGKETLNKQFLFQLNNINYYD